MRVIDLLNKIANGKDVPQKIKIEDKTYTLFIDEDTGYHYYKDDERKNFMFSISRLERLNDEVEVIEEDKKIEEIDIFDYFTGYDYGGTNKELLKDLEHNFETLNSKINEIIDYIMEDK